MNAVRQAELFSTLPPEWPDDPLPALHAALGNQRDKIVVLDDDPTGTQTVHSVPVLTDWPVVAFCAELENDLPAFYVLTNSRSLPLARAQSLNAEIGQNLMEAARRTGRGFVVISRSDSTLRGHFPGEVEALASALGDDFDSILLIPAFFSGGRYTVTDVHYVADGDWLVPAGETEFARDAAFGYRASNLREWVAEKTMGRIPPENVVSIRLEDVRGGGPERVAALLSALRPGSVCVVNAASDHDLAIVTLAAVQAEAQGRRFLYRTAASFVPLRSGLTPRPLLAPAELDLPKSGGGLIVVGSHVPKTAVQLSALLAMSTVTGVEVEVGALLDDRRRQREIDRVAEVADRILHRDSDVGVFTSRHFAAGADPASSLRVGQRVSDGLVAIVQAITTRPRYLLAKGGITSSDVATKGLSVKRALVLGQILPGVPVWKLGPESRHPGLAYIVFPGNVGGPQALAEIVTALEVS